MSPNQIEKTRGSGAKITAMRKVGTDPDGESGGGSGGSGGGKDGSGGLFNEKDAEKALISIDPQRIGKGRKEATNSVLESRQELSSLGVHPKAIDDILTKALIRGQAKTDWTNDSIEFQPDVFQRTVDEGVQNALNGTYVKYGIKEPIDATKAKAFLDKRKSTNAASNAVLPPVVADGVTATPTTSVLPKPIKSSIGQGPTLLDNKNAGVDAAVNDLKKQKSIYNAEKVRTMYFNMDADERAYFEKKYDDIYERAIVYK